jgi:hypothetical protein
MKRASDFVNFKFTVYATAFFELQDLVECSLVNCLEIYTVRITLFEFELVKTPIFLFVCLLDVVASVATWVRRSFSSIA